ncbi:MAG: NnrU family protein [Pseudomonadota bacterium]
MFLLILGLALFAALHLPKPMALPQRAALVEKIGDGGVKGVFALGLVLSVVLMTIGYQSATFVNVWFPPAFLTGINNLLMIFAIGIFIAGGIPGHVRHWIRHPQLVGFKLWAVAHLLVNGDLASIILFGGLLAWAVVTLIMINKRDGKGPKPAPQGLMPNLIHGGVTVVAFLGATAAHNWLGVYPFG